jgi:MarR family transcriptional regulator, multiple antibiotic resistance protein MarR
MHDAIEFFDSLVRSETRLYNVVGERIREAHDLSVGQLEFLRYIRDHANSRISDLAKAFAVGIGTTSKAVDRLEANGWVVRTPNPANRRSSILAVTAAGRRLADRADETFAAAIGDYTAALTTAELAAVTLALDALRESLESRGAGLPAG